jgi:hypothetical protein
MPNGISIILEEGSVEAVLDDSPTAEAIQAALPLEGSVSRWGDEIYFGIPVTIEEASNARQDMAVGELGYWPTGSAFCIFWGPTPASAGDLPRAYSNVNPFGKLERSADTFKTLLSAARDGQTIRVVASGASGD